MASTRAETLRANEERIVNLQPFSPCSHIPPPLKGSVQPVSLCTCQDQTGLPSEHNLSVHGLSQIGRYETDPFLIIAKKDDPNMLSQTLVIEDEVRLIFNYKSRFYAIVD